MARQLTFEITAQTYEAEAKLRYLEQEIADLNKQLKTGQITWEQYEKSLKNTSASAAAASEILQKRYSVAKTVACRIGPPRLAHVRRVLRH